ncbi:heme A synthase [Parageobacillus sp. VR-IP]|uniref:COX15/CtaA family protein n=1 Tax=Parageobacillus sp. VR-IP TaxID=2742205 RepID=UPI0020C82C59|nr:COX15/CtaA family protein [Parageobacillus sp. VR-IP]
MRIRHLSLLTLVVTYILIVFGGYVASSESGMGCGPDWPLCNGVLIPMLKGATLIEYAHRVIGAFLALLAVILFLQIIRTYRESSIRSVAFWMIGLLVLQVLLGALVVIWDLPPIVVTIHLLIAMAFLCCIIWIWRFSHSGFVRSKSSPGKANYGETKRILAHVNGIFALLVATFAIGAYIKHKHYGLACSWLDCRDSWLPINSAQFWQTSHRFLAAVSAIYILWLAGLAFYRNWNNSIRRRLLLMVAAVLTQAAFGIMTIITNIQLPWAVSHLAVGTFLFAIVFETRVFMNLSHLHSV